MTSLRAFLRTFRDAVARANVSINVGGVSVALSPASERQPSRIVAGHVAGYIASERLTDERGVLLSNDAGKLERNGS